MNIRKKLFLMLFVILFAIGAMTTATYLRGSSVIQNIAESVGIQVVDNGVKFIDGQLSHTITSFNLLSDSILYALQSLGLNDESGIELLMYSMSENISKAGFVRVYLGFDFTGKISDSSKWEEPADFDARRRPWYRQAVEAKGETVFSDPYVDGPTKSVVVSISKAVYDTDGKLFGVLGGDIKLDMLHDYVSSLRIFGKGNGLLLMRDGTVLSGPFEEDILKVNMTTDVKIPVSLRETAYKMISGERGKSHYLFNGLERLMFFAPTEHKLSLGIIFPIKDMSALVRSLTMVLLGISTVTFVVVALVVLMVNRGLTRSIKSMHNASERLGNGDLTVRYDESTKDEFASISRRLNATVDSLRDSMVDIRLAADETAEQSMTLAELSGKTLASMEAVTASTEQILKTLEENAIILQTTDSSIEGIAAGAHSTAEAATHGAEGTSTAAERAEGASEELDRALGDIKNAEGVSIESIERLDSLKKSVDAITQFVDTIKAIADQTNLLALNAAIEAARAGEAGRGFAVVADEVRKLAEESSRAASEVGGLISELQEHSQNSIDATERTRKLLGETTVKTTSARDRLKDTLTVLNRLTENIQNVASVSEEQAAESAELNESMHRVSETTERMVEAGRSVGSATRETTLAAERIAEESDIMAKTSENLLFILRRFSV